MSVVLTEKIMDSILHRTYSYSPKIINICSIYSFLLLTEWLFTCPRLDFVQDSKGVRGRLVFTGLSDAARCLCLPGVSTCGDFRDTHLSIKASLPGSTWQDTLKSPILKDLEPERGVTMDEDWGTDFHEAPTHQPL